MTKSLRTIGIKVPRKRHYDLREYWPWYERKWPTRYGLHATPPPFDLSDMTSAARKQHRLTSAS